jgi:iron complex outermembrane receptor protein
MMPILNIYERYALLDIKSSYVFALAKVLQVELHAGVNNALDRKYG